MAFLTPLAFGTAATAGGAAATAGLFGAGGSFALAPTLMTLGTVASVAGSIQAGNAAKKAAEYNAATKEAEAQAEEYRRRQAARRQIGSIRAGVAKSGAAFEGTPLMVLAESAANAEIDALNARWSGGTQANLYRMEGRQAQRAGYIRAGTSLLTAASRFA